MKRLLVCLSTLLIFSCADSSEPLPPPNILLILIDTLRSDHLPSYGYKRDTAPRLNALAKRGTLFERVIAPSSWTKTSMASLMTGRNPNRHHVRGPTDVLGQGLLTMAEAFSSDGYETLGFITNPWLKPNYGFEQGFTLYRDITERGSGFLPASQVNAAALEEIRRLGAGPYLLYVHYMDVHAPYHPVVRYFLPKTPSLRVPDHSELPEKDLEVLYRKRNFTAPGVQQRVIDLYDAEIRGMDDAVSELLDTFEREGALENTIIVVTSDHGEAFMEHGTTEHGWNLYPEVLLVPLIVVWPGQVPAGERVSAQVRSVDLMPTLLHMAGLPMPAGLDGQSLYPFEDVSSDRIAVTALGLNDVVPNRDYVAVVSREHLYIRDRMHDTIEFYDLVDDPGALTDLGRAHRAVAKYAALEGPATRPAARHRALDDGTRSRLRALGYLQDRPLVTHASPSDGSEYARPRSSPNPR